MKQRWSQPNGNNSTIYLPHSN